MQFSKKTLLYIVCGLLLCALCAGFFYMFYASNTFALVYDSNATTTPLKVKPQLDKLAYNEALIYNAHYGTTTTEKLLAALVATSTARLLATSTVSGHISWNVGSTTQSLKLLWPVKTVYPNYGALLPGNRIVAYYGNYYSTQMGVLGQYPPDEMITRLQAAVAQWQAADPSTPVIPALDYIAVTAQAAPGKDGKYRAQMPDSQIDKTLELAKQVNGIVILDIQVGLSSVQVEVPLLEKYLMMPNVELALDPEFAMHGGAAPGTVVGSLDASDINFAANYLAQLVRQYNLPPKILIIHRFTDPMVTHVPEIVPLPEVQMVMDMDGWGDQARKINTYEEAIYSQPVQFTGFKLFYKNDLKAPSTGLLTPAQVLDLTPQPLFIQYQ